MEARGRCQAFDTRGGARLGNDLDQSSMHGGGQFTLRADPIVCGAMGRRGHQQDFVLCAADGLSGRLEVGRGGSHRDGGRGFEKGFFTVVLGLGWHEQHRAWRQSRGNLSQMVTGVLDHGSHQR